MKERLKAWGNTKVIGIVGAFVINEDGQLLLLRRHPEDLGGGQWGTPGGRINEGESAEIAMYREFYEETGLNNRSFDLLGIHQISMPHGTVIMTSYTAKISKNTRILLDPDEHSAFDWFNLKSLLGENNILWGIPTILHDFGFIEDFGDDPTLADGSSVKLLSLAS